MKKTIVTIAIFLGLSMATFADPIGGGLFQHGVSDEQMNSVYVDRAGSVPMLPNHGETGNQNAPLGTGITVLAAFGAAYIVSKKRRED